MITSLQQRIYKSNKIYVYQSISIIFRHDIQSKFVDIVKLTLLVSKAIRILPKFLCHGKETQAPTCSVPSRFRSSNYNFKRYCRQIGNVFLVPIWRKLQVLFRQKYKKFFLNKKRYKSTKEFNQARNCTWLWQSKIIILSKSHLKEKKVSKRFLSKMLAIMIQ